MKSSSQIYKIDNIKFLLIFLVVFGHLCEYIHFRGSSFLYLLIYSFHMPAFAFLSGYCSSPKPGEVLLKKYAFPYIVFQILYIAYAKFILHKEVNFQFTTPYWILWYLLALFVWKLTISIFSANKAVANKIVMFSIPLALLSGYDATIGYYLSLSRIIVIFPFFAGGYCLKSNGIPIFNTLREYKLLSKCLSLLGAILMLSILYNNKDILNVAWAYHSSPYQAQQCNIIIRFFFLLTAVVFTVFLCIFVPNRKIPLLTYIGQNTLGIFLLHGFIVRYLAYIGIIQVIPYPQFTTALLALAIILLLSSKVVNLLLKPFVK